MKPRKWDGKTKARAILKGIKGGLWVSSRCLKVCCRQKRERGMRISRRGYFNSSRSYKQCYYWCVTYIGYFQKDLKKEWLRICFPV